jgi:hypothetical protein
MDALPIVRSPGAASVDPIEPLRCRVGRVPGYNRRSSPVQFSPGSRFGPYEVIAAIGAGGMGENESEQGRTHIHVVGLSNGNNKVQISTTGGDFPRWRRDGKEIFYLTPDRVLMAAAVKSEGPSLQVGSIERLFEIRPRLGVGVGGAASLSGRSFYEYDVSEDGQRILVNTRLENDAPVPITLIVNWPGTTRK